MSGFGEKLARNKKRLIVGAVVGGILAVLAIWFFNTVYDPFMGDVDDLRLLVPPDSDYVLVAPDFPALVKGLENRTFFGRLHRNDAFQRYLGADDGRRQAVAAIRNAWRQLDRVSGELKLKVRVQCTDWLDIDRVQVLVNGRQPAEYNYTRRKNPDLFADGVVKFDQTLTLNLSQDAHVIVVAIGENFSLAKGFGGSAQASIRPIAYNNPIYVDVDGGGFRPNGDTLGFDLPVAGLSVDEVKARLGEE
ncbi:MAG: hypothetical protein KDM91_16425 [Verrucomicrobiae bacterium]|nr:hypothetical protein [Verrucomicrobiae bacterium]